MSLYKKLKVYFIYRKIIKANKSFLVDPKFNLKIDRLCRLYTVLNFPDNYGTNSESEAKTYGQQIVKKTLDDYVRSVDYLLTQVGLIEMTGLLETKRIDDYNILVVFGYSFFDTKKMANRTVFITSAITILITLFILFHK